MNKITNTRLRSKFKGCVRGLSPVIATLLMIVIAVVASLVVYAWLSGFTGTTITNLSVQMQIPSFTSVYQNGQNLLTIYVQNTGQVAVKLNRDGTVYTNNTLVPIITYTDASGVVRQAIPGQLITLNVGQTITLVVQYTFNPGDYVTIKVVTASGISTQTSGIGALSGSAAVNPSPIALFFVSSINGQTVSFNAASSYSPEGTIASYTWNFGNSKAGTGINPSYTYSFGGTYTVSLTVTDNEGLTGSVSHSVNVP